MIKIKDLTAKNFMSIGNATQAVDFNRNDLTLVIGENIDLGGGGAKNGVGKAQPLYSKIKTPGSWTTMGEIKINDVILCPDGSTSKVTGVFPQGLTETFRLHFTDGRTTDACKDHLWKVFSHSFGQKNVDKWKILSTEDIIKHNNEYKDFRNKSSIYKYIQLIQPEEIKDIELPLDPYFLGAMLGDGGMTVHGIGFTTADAELFENMQKVLPENYKMTKDHYNKYGYSFTNIVKKKVSTLRLALTELKLYGTKSGTKFIPELYMNASVKQKIELIRGLVDTDGYVAKNGAMSITTVSKEMANNIQTIIQSIGGIATIKLKSPCGYKKDGLFIQCQDAYNISIMYNTPKNLSNLSRKKDLLPGDDYQYRNRKLRIDKIESIGLVESQCIMIDHPEHLYITDNYIVTHNTSMLNALSYALYGQALSNIKLNNLINKTNAKNMLVSIDFDIDSVKYRIERGRKPNLLRFFVDDVEQHDDEARGEMRDTQKEINGLLNISHDMFKHTIALNTYTEPFLSMRAHDQKNIIEQLLGITLLTEKADKLKEKNRTSKNNITEEEFRIAAVIKANEHIEDQIKKLEMRQRLWAKKKEASITSITADIEQSMNLNISNELQLHKDLENWTILDGDITQLNKYIKQLVKDNKTLDRELIILEKDIAVLEDHKCHACGQDLHDDKQAENIKLKQSLAQEKTSQFLTNETQENEHKMRLAEIGDIGEKPKLFYEIYEDALQHQHTLNSLTKDLETALESVDPYDEQVEEMKADGLVQIDYTHLNYLTEMQEHQAFLLKLLTSKDSFIRRKIIEQNLSYLNNRLTHYLEEIKLPHQIHFLSDLSVEITELGRDLDFDNLSRGERTRLILALSWAFRDVWESLYNHVNLLFVDELVDSGLDSDGVEASIKIMKSMARERNKSVWLVSHREELTARVHNTMIVRKQGGFTSYGGLEE